MVNTLDKVKGNLQLTAKGHAQLWLSRLYHNAVCAGPESMLTVKVQITAMVMFLRTQALCWRLKP